MVCEQFRKQFCVNTSREEEDEEEDEEEKRREEFSLASFAPFAHKFPINLQR